MQLGGRIPGPLPGAAAPSGSSGSGVTSSEARAPTEIKNSLDPRKPGTSESPQWGVKRASSILLELEAGEREAEEKKTLNSRLFELGTELRKVRQVNNILEAENADLRERILHQAEKYPEAAEIRALARRYGPELARSISLLIDENKALRLKLQSSIRAQARLQATSTRLGDALREHEERAYAKELEAAGSRVAPEAAAKAPQYAQKVSTISPRAPDISLCRTESPNGGNFVQRYCACSEKLQEILDCIDFQIKDYERGVWQTQVNVLEEERDNLMLKTIVMRQRLAEVQARIVSDPFLAARFGGAGAAQEAVGLGNGRNAMTELRDTIVQLATAQDINVELERRLASERNISRSWQANLRALQRELRDHLSDLAVAARASGLRCDLLRGTIAQAGEAAALREIQGFTRSEKESLRLLRLARDRIAADAHRIESYSIRVRELEQEVADLRCDMTRLEKGEREEWEEGAHMPDWEYKGPVALTGGSIVTADTDSRAAALRTAKELLIGRAETQKVIDAVQDRICELHEQEKDLLASADGCQRVSNLHQDDSTILSVDQPEADIAPLVGQSGHQNPYSKLYDALTTDRAREVLRRLVVLRRIASTATVSVEEARKAAESTGETNSHGIVALKKIRNDIDQREITLQQAEEAMRARLALRRAEAEHKKKLRKKEEEFEEQRRKDSIEAREELLKQQREYEQQLEKERDRCESLRKEIELQAMELDLQRQLAEERIRERSRQQNSELEDELHKLRKEHRELEFEVQRVKAEAARETLALKSAATEERSTLSAAVQAAERKAKVALDLVKEKEQELKDMENRLKQSLGSNHTSPSLPPPLAEKKGSKAALKKLQAVAQKVAMGQTFTRLARNKRSKTITPGASKPNRSVGGGNQLGKAGPAVLSPRSSFKEFVLGKYTSLASAFRHMDVDHSGIVKLSEFANFVDDLGMNLPFSDTHDLYNTLSAPCDGMLVLSNFYKNLLEAFTSIPSARSYKIFGDVEQPFNDAKIPPDGRVTKEQFVTIAGEAGIILSCANALWRDMDRSNRGSLQRENVLLLLEDNVDREEVERVEQDATNLLSNVLNVFSGTTKAPKPEAKICRRSSFKKLTYTAARQALGFTPSEAQVDAVLADSPPWDCMYPEDRKAMIADMKPRTVGKGQLIQAEEDHNCPLYVILKGSVDIFQPGFIQYRLLENISAPCLLYSEEIMEGMPNATCAKADQAEDVFLYSLDRSVFERSYERLAVQRQREVEDYQKLLRKVPVVNKLAPELLRCLAAGETASRVLMVKDGEAAAVGFADIDDEVEIRVFRSLDFFGDITTVKGRSHTASVRARTDCTVLSIDSDVFYSVLRKLEMEFRRRSGRSATVDCSIMNLHSRAGHVNALEDDPNSRSPSEALEEDLGGDKPSLGESLESSQITSTALAIPTQEETLAIPTQEKTLVDHDLIERLLQEDTERTREECNLLLEGLPVLKDLPKERRHEICNRMSLEIYSPHQAIVLQGEAPDKFYVLESGTVSTEIYLGCGKMQKISEMTSGSFFGEMSILQHEPRTAYVIALTPVYVYALKAADFEELLGDMHVAFLEHAKSMYSQKLVKRIIAKEESTPLSEEEVPQVVQLLSGVPVINLLSVEQLQGLARAFKVEEVREREIIMHEGDPADKFYIVLEGMASIQKSPEPGKPRKEIAVVKAGDYLGEIGFINNQPRTASCVAKTKVKLLYLGRAEFDKHLGHLADAFLQKAESTYSTPEVDMPAWLLSAKAQGAFYTPSSIKDSPEEPDEAISTGSLTRTSDEAEAKAYKEKKEKKKSSDSSHKTDSEHSGGSHVDEEKKKKKKKKPGGKEVSKDKDKALTMTSSGAPVSITAGDLDRLRELVVGTFKNKYGSLAHAFAEMDVNKSDIVDADEFYAFTKKSNIRGFQKQEIDALFDELCRPIKGRLVVGNLYRNARGVEPSGAEIHLRAVEIYGSALNAFSKIASIEGKDLCTRENFTSLSANVGVDSDKAESIWDEYTKGVHSSDDRITLSTLIGLMSGKINLRNSSLLCHLTDTPEIHSCSDINVSWGGGGVLCSAHLYLVIYLVTTTTCLINFGSPSCANHACGFELAESYFSPLVVASSQSRP
ncbi:CAMP-dependent protein kinase regulatory subunit, putative [Eimeria necatrix]|uniref:cAMP-dependent protein kinase regulatory subunit, putative n=1 Tax=Eimeria necatrix TaxID=51315 RepID=U6MW65_9EIME|nr:CAMP-dependent protein kinase regulatory subunit, putative [Eimeria necatrix]CDJ66729.1 CAMP-dependent protein kinase regulatory subunit, putative [Eimeria necatrix]